MLIITAYKQENFLATAENNVSVLVPIIARLDEYWGMIGIKGYKHREPNMQPDRPAECPNVKWLTDITEIKACDGKVYLLAMIDCYDGKIVAHTAGFSPNAELANKMLEQAVETLPGNVRPLVHSDRDCHYRWPGWLALMERFGLTRSMSAKGRSLDNAAAEGFFGRMKVEAVYPERWEERARDEVLALIDEYIHWHNHEHIKQSLDWKSPVQYRIS